MKLCMEENGSCCLVRVEHELFLAVRLEHELFFERTRKFRKRKKLRFKGFIKMNFAFLEFFVFKIIFSFISLLSCSKKTLGVLVSDIPTS